MKPGLTETSSERRPARSLHDRFGRTMKRLRVSLTDRCNFRCAYCMPARPVWRAKEELLSFEELRQLMEVFVTRLGIEQLRLTGGEPLVRIGVPQLVATLSELRCAGLRRVSLSTNGVLLARYARELADAGLDDVNVSLDSLSPAQFRQISGGGNLRDVLAGIYRAREVGLPVKINAVVIRGTNDADVLPLARWAYHENFPLRFIEFMPLDSRGLWSPDKVFTERELIALLSSEFEIMPMARASEPASYYCLNGSFRLGVISTVSRPFCSLCDRVRLTADGRLFACLFSPAGVDLKDAFRAKLDHDLLESRILAAVFNKPRGFVEKSTLMNGHAGMHVLGG
jgi:cyclic pyranopterin phosphate synthase